MYGGGHHSRDQLYNPNGFIEIVNEIERHEGGRGSMNGYRYRSNHGYDHKNSNAEPNYHHGYTEPGFNSQQSYAEFIGREEEGHYRY